MPLPVSKLLLLDTGIVLELFRLGLWEVVLERYEVHISEMIVTETKFYENDQGEHISIDLNVYKNRMTIHSVDLADVRELKKSFGTNILERIDDGEVELLSRSNAERMLYSGDFKKKYKGLRLLDKRAVIAWPLNNIAGCVLNKNATGFLLYGSLIRKWVRVLKGVICCFGGVILGSVGVSALPCGLDNIAMVKGAAVRARGF